YTGKARPQLSELCFDPPRHLLWVGPWELLNDEQETRTVVENVIPDERLMIFHHRSHVAQGQLRPLNIHLGEILRRGNGQDMPDLDPLLGPIDPPAAPGRRCVQEGEWRHPQGITGG